MENEGLLFYLSGEHGECPETAGGNPVPNFFQDVEIVEDGKQGKALRCLPSQLLAYWAPGNIYAQRGTLSFFWRSRTPLGPTEFPLFRVSFADHSSWDGVFLRIDYNGRGIDAFVTDINLSRIRVSAEFSQMPEPDQWFHVAFAWDETEGARLYLDGRLAAEKHQEAILYAGLDQLGTHSRIISNAQVQSSYNYMRTGDFDEIRIYDRMLADEQILQLSQCRELKLSPMEARDLREEKWKKEWDRRFGFDAEEKPASLSQRFMAVHKVEIHNAWDHKRWWWKACDGIRETTWPGVYNRSGLPGRTDYFVLPDWDCYSVSGKEITFEPDADQYFNHIELSGAAEGQLRIHGRMEEQLNVRRSACERSVLRLPEPVRNVNITFTNEQIEQPIGDITLLQVEPGMAPEGVRRDTFWFTEISAEEGRTDEPGLKEIQEFIHGRFLPDERLCFLGRRTPRCADGKEEKRRWQYLPLAHFLLPYGQQEGVGFDGLLLHLPGLSVRPASGEGWIYVNVQIKDPLWIYRNLLQFTFALRPGKCRDIWLDTRDRILPEGKAMYVSLAFSEPVEIRELAEVRMEMVYKEETEAKKEHIEDRWVQVKDNYANLVEENPSNAHFNLYNRFLADITDLLKVCPDHPLARQYWYDKFKTNPPEMALSVCPPEIPLWAWRQTEYMGYVKRYIRWWIDKRQIENGEFGGGLSDDGDLTAWWPGPALAGCMPEKIGRSLALEMEAFYDQGMFSNGLCAIQTDQLHTLEEGIQCLGQCLTLFPDSPRYLERAMENVRGLYYVTGYNKAGHRHMLSGYYSGTRIAREAPWNYSASDSFHVFHPAYMLARYNGSPKARALILEMADSMLAHYYDGRLHVLIDVETDADQVHERTREWPLFYAAWKLTGNREYLKPIDEGLSRQQQERIAAGRSPKQAAAEYEELIRKAALREYINTDGQLWVDRGVIDIGVMQQDRIGGIGHERFSLYPRHYFRWRFPESKERDVAVMVTYASTERICLQGYNLSDEEITAEWIPEDIIPGCWEMRIRTGKCSFDREWKQIENALRTVQTAQMELEWMQGTQITFAGGCCTEVEFTLQNPGIPYWERTDLAIDREDVLIREDCIRVRVHNIGAVDSQETTLVLRSPEGSVLRTSQIPPIPAPTDLYPKIVEIPLWTRGISLEGCSVELDPEHRLQEITRTNNRIVL